MDLNTMTVDEIWGEVERKTQEEPEHIIGVDATYTFEITGDDGATYGLIVKDGTAKVVEGGLDDAECTITLNVKNFKKLLQGDLNATTAFMTGRLKVKGNIGLALKLESVLKQYDF